MQDDEVVSDCSDSEAESIHKLMELVAEITKKYCNVCVDRTASGEQDAIATEFSEEHAEFKEWEHAMHLETEEFAQHPAISGNLADRCYSVKRKYLIPEREKITAKKRQLEGVIGKEEELQKLNRHLEQITELLRKRPNEVVLHKNLMEDLLKKITPQDEDGASAEDDTDEALTDQQINTLSTKLFSNFVDFLMLSGVSYMYKKGNLKVPKFFHYRDTLPNQGFPLWAEFKQELPKYCHRKNLRSTSLDDKHIPYGVERLRKIFDSFLPAPWGEDGNDDGSEDGSEDGSGDTEEDEDESEDKEGDTHLLKALMINSPKEMLQFLYRMMKFWPSLQEKAMLLDYHRSEESLLESILAFENSKEKELQWSQKQKMEEEIDAYYITGTHDISPEWFHKFHQLAVVVDLDREVDCGNKKTKQMGDDQKQPRRGGESSGKHQQLKRKQQPTQQNQQNQLKSLGINFTHHPRRTRKNTSDKHRIYTKKHLNFIQNVLVPLFEQMCARVVCVLPFSRDKITTHERTPKERTATHIHEFFNFLLWYDWRSGDMYGNSKQVHMKRKDLWNHCKRLLVMNPMMASFALAFDSEENKIFNQIEETGMQVHEVEALTDFDGWYRLVTPIEKYNRIWWRARTACLDLVKTRCNPWLSLYCLKAIYPQTVNDWNPPETLKIYGSMVEHIGGRCIASYIDLVSDRDRFVVSCENQGQKCKDNNGKTPKIPVPRIDHVYAEETSTNSGDPPTLRILVHNMKQLAWVTGSSDWDMVAPIAEGDGEEDVKQKLQNNESLHTFGLSHMLRYSEAPKDDTPPRNTSIGFKGRSNYQHQLNQLLHKQQVYLEWNSVDRRQNTEHPLRKCRLRALDLIRPETNASNDFLTFSTPTEAILKNLYMYGFQGYPPERRKWQKLQISVSRTGKIWHFEIQTLESRKDELEHLIRECDKPIHGHDTRLPNHLVDPDVTAALKSGNQAAIIRANKAQRDIMKFLVHLKCKWVAQLRTVEWRLEQRNKWKQLPDENSRANKWKQLKSLYYLSKRWVRFLRRVADLQSDTAYFYNENEQSEESGESADDDSAYATSPFNFHEGETMWAKFFGVIQGVLPESVILKEAGLQKGKPLTRMTGEQVRACEKASKRVLLHVHPDRIAANGELFERLIEGYNNMVPAIQYERVTELCQECFHIFEQFFKRFSNEDKNIDKSNPQN